MPTSQIMRYGIVGLTAVAIHYAVLITLVELADMRKLVASIIGFCAAIPFNYYFQHRWVFRSRNDHSLALTRYMIVTTLGLAINSIVFHTGLAVGLPYLLAQAVAILLVTAFNFIANRFYTFTAYSAVQR
ncbi:MAG: GtrA family protein [Mesorhizobium sp.]|uniref:GtrA family protein n=1 Tax=Mesorhizobium sp. TaxID=1871066 RepID=UPI001AC79CBA|nr:GtrA family protein [Mesorhizobium sp.]MBN9221603.1 GtrA family protein [Mesorhizobium sp.]